MIKRALWVAFVLLALALIATVLVQQRHQLLMGTLGDSSPPPLLPVAEEGPDARWLDDYFLIVELDAQTFAIVEPRYEQQNINYLIVGFDRAVLFDAGSGLRDVAAAAATLTNKPITFVPSHLHYDHIGQGGPFARLALIDLPHLRERAKNNRLQLGWSEHLGSAEGYEPPELSIDEWLIPNSVMSLGGRALRVLYTPGHTDDSISLLDTARNQLFSGDFVYQGPLFAFLPNSSLGDYQQGATTLLNAINEDVRVYGAHRSGPQGVPVLSRNDIAAVHETLQKIAAGEIQGEGSYPLSFAVTKHITLLVEPPWLQNWEQRYPDL